MHDTDPVQEYLDLFTKKKIIVFRKTSCLLTSR